MLELMPGLADVRILRSWSGVIGPSSDGLPILEACATPRGFILATGFGGNGFVTGPAVGKSVAAARLHRRLVNGHRRPAALPLRSVWCCRDPVSTRGL